ncbi:LysR family transcriptional regulator [Neorhizobium sp. DT-125]|uniref:LysR family transcriptional regulator n=1 Tax=Neorhizobium sp. DT-125 TaxID=3396163 RepID=UPI003F1C6833
MDEFQRFLAVAEAGNVSRAAEALHLSQPALSRSIALLEQRFKTRLFKRTSGGVELTAAGRTLYQHASRALRTIRDAEERILYDAVGGNLSLKICAGDTWGYTILPEIVAEFRRSRPNVIVTLDVVNHDTRVNGIKSGEYDVAYGIVSPSYDYGATQEFQPMIAAQYQVYCRERHPLREKADISADDLDAEGWIRHIFEYDHDPNRWKVTKRTYAVATNRMTSTVELIRNTDLLMSTSFLFADLFSKHSVVGLCPDPASTAMISGALFLRSDLVKPVTKQFHSLCRRRCSERFPDYSVSSQEW